MPIKKWVYTAGMVVLLASCGENGVDEAEVSRSQHAIEGADQDNGRADVNHRLKVGAVPTYLDGDSAWREFLSNAPDARAWVLRDRVEKLRIAKGLSAVGWELERRQLGKSLAELWPAPQVVKVETCEGAELDCDSDDPTRHDIANPTQEVRSQVTSALWSHVLRLIEQYPFFRTSASEVATRNTPRRVVRSHTGFELEVERTVAGLPVLGSPQLVRFDSEGNILGFNKGFVTDSENDRIKALRVLEADQGTVAAQAQNYVQTKGIGEDGIVPTRLSETHRFYDAIRGSIVDVVRLTDSEGNGSHLVHVDVTTGEVLTDYPGDAASYTDAQTKRAKYTSGDLMDSYSITSTGVYTKDDNELVHDFFYVMNERRCENATLATCPSCVMNAPVDSVCSEQPLDHCLEAMTFGHDGYIRASVRPNRDFTFSDEDAAEPHAYYWARDYLMWQKSALTNLGLLAPDPADWPQALIIVNACRKSAFTGAASTIVRTDNSATNSLRRIFFRNYPFESDSGSDWGQFDFTVSPSVVAHELNHFVMHDYLGVDYSVDCNAGDEGALIHEGALGSVLPHRHWESRYGIGYAPAPQSRLWFSSSETGRVHVGAAGLMTTSTYACEGNHYFGGRVLGQALWKIAFGRDYNGAGTLITIAGIPTTADFIETLYEAARQNAGGSREALAWEFTWYARYELGLIGNADVVDWCEMFSRHGLDGEFTNTCGL